MIDVKKLHNTINELENHSATLARVAGLYDKLEKFKTELDILHNIISDNGSLLGKTDTDIRASIEILKSQLANMPIELKALKTELEKGSDEIYREISNRFETFAATLHALRTELEKGSDEIHREISNRFEMFAGALQALRTDIDKGNTTTRQEINNRFDVFLADQKSELKTLLNDMQSLQNKHKLDIEVAIRNEGAQVQRGLENIVKENHLTLQTTLDQCFSDMSVKIVKQHKYSFIGFALMGINAILLLATLWFLRHQIF